MRVLEGLKFRYLLFLGAILLILAPLFVSAKNPCEGLSPKQCQQLRDALAREIQKNRELAAKKRKEAEELKKIISQLDRDIAATQAKITNTQSQIDKTQNEINDIQAQIAQKEKELKIEEENQDEALRVMYETVNQNTLEILIGSENLSEVVTYSEYLEALEIKIENTIAEIERLKKELEAKRVELEKKKRELLGLKKQLEVQKNNLAFQKQEKNVLLSDTKNQMNSYLKTAAELEERLAQARIVQSTANYGGDLISSIDYSWYYSQLDPRWAGERLGHSPFQNVTIGNYGCLITSLAMIITKYGTPVTPSDIAQKYWLFTPDGSFNHTILKEWGIIVTEWYIYNNVWATINSELSSGYPVIVGLDLPNANVNVDGVDHFVVIKGISNGKYLIHDPIGPGRSYAASQVIRVITIRPR